MPPAAGARIAEELRGRERIKQLEKERPERIKTEKKAKEDDHFHHRWHVDDSLAEVVHESLHKLYESLSDDELIKNSKCEDHSNIKCKYEIAGVVKRPTNTHDFNHIQIEVDGESNCCRHTVAKILHKLDTFYLRYLRQLAERHPGMVL